MFAKKCLSAMGWQGSEPVRASYPKTMSNQTSQLLEAFEALPAEEKRIFTVEFLRRAIPFDSGPLEDEETARAADELLNG
jgi:hypothetical protein